jgi:hypothetical protein
MTHHGTVTATVTATVTVTATATVTGTGTAIVTEQSGHTPNFKNSLLSFVSSVIHTISCY